MRKQIFTALIVLMLLLCGCSEVVPTESGEVISETDAESTSSLLSSESKDTAIVSTKPTDTPETATSEPPKDESELEESAPAVTAPKEPAAHNDTASTAPTESIPPKETPKPVASTPEATPAPTPDPTPEPTPEAVQPKSAYDAPFDITTIQSDCISVGYGMGLSLDSSLTPSNATWWNPVTASQSNQGAALKQNLESYIKFHTVDNLGSYGIDEITSFNIYCEARGNGAYSIYFLFA